MAPLTKNQMAPLRPVPQQRIRYAKVTDNLMDSRMGQILKAKPTKIAQQTSNPIMSPTYKEDLRRADMLLGIDPLFTESVLARVEVRPQVTSFTKKITVADDIISKVVSDLKVNGNKISINFTCPIENLYTKYYSKGTMPPLNERVLAYSKLGYSDLKLAKMIKFEDDKKKKYIELDKFIETIFGDSSKKKTTTVPKKKTLLQMIGYKKPKYATNDDSVDEDEEV